MSNLPKTNGSLLETIENENREKSRKKINQIFIKLIFLAALLLLIVALSCIWKRKNNRKNSSVSHIAQTNITLSDIGVVTYNGSPYRKINGNQPFFDMDEYKDCDQFEEYSEMDKLGRCGVAYALISYEMMPQEDREGVGQIKPSGWNQKKYPGIVDSEPPYLYNRCHLIAHGLTGQNANEKNLITGTRYFNVEGMLPFELQVMRYIEDTHNLVLYRVTPLFEGQNLLASGVEMEACSIEDGGAGICFNVFVYNVQPGIRINYKDGSSQEEK